MRSIKKTNSKKASSKKTTSKKASSKKTISEKITSEKITSEKITSKKTLLKNYVEELNSLKSNIYWDILFSVAFIYSTYIDLLAVTVGIAMFYHAIAILNLIHNIIIYSYKIPIHQQSKLINNTKIIKTLRKKNNKLKVKKETEVFILIRNLHVKCLGLVFLVYFVMFIFGVFSGNTIFAFTAAWITLMITEFYVKYKKNTALNKLIEEYS